MKALYLIGGTMGVGKTTISQQLKKDFRKYCEADDILARVRELIRENESQFEV